VLGSINWFAVVLQQDVCLPNWTIQKCKPKQFTRDNCTKFRKQQGFIVDGGHQIPRALLDNIYRRGAFHMQIHEHGIYPLTGYPE
jgi:hypothetical protein